MCTITIIKFKRLNLIFLLSEAPQIINVFMYNFYNGLKKFYKKLNIIFSLVGDDYSITSDGNCLKMMHIFQYFTLYYTQIIVLVFLFY